MEELVDYYIENGMLVFTKEYHLKRGYCCKSGCRHCPWGFIKNNSKQPESPENNTDNIKE